MLERKCVAFIPLRGGSKSIKDKNIRSIAGKPLAYWVLDAADKCRHIDEIYVATDSALIRECIKQHSSNKIRLIGRSRKTATDSATTESALLEFASKYYFDIVVLIQATSPLLKANDLDKAFQKFDQDNFASCLSVVRQKRFVWIEDLKSGSATPINYMLQSRPRRQDFDGFLVENGAFYITNRQDLLLTKCRLTPPIATYEMDEESYFEIDEPRDFIIVEDLLKRRYSERD